jgi:magnesium transporter
MDARVSVVSNNLNVLMKSLNFIMISLMVPTLWVSVFSMNLVVPFAENPKMFWFVVSTAATLPLVVFLIRKIKKL